MDRGANETAENGGAGASPEQGTSVALSSDGNTALVGGAETTTRRGRGVGLRPQRRRLVQQGSKLIGTGAINGPYSPAQGRRSRCRPTATPLWWAGRTTRDGAGAVWVFTRSGGVWSQQGSKLVGTGVIGSGQHQGQSVALSSDGNTALVGGPGDAYGDGALWVFTQRRRLDPARLEAGGDRCDRPRLPRHLGRAVRGRQHSAGGRA